MGSELPGGYSTMSIRPSLPGRFVRSFDMSCVTLASGAASVPDMSHAIARVSIMDFISGLRCGFRKPGVEASLAEPRGFGRHECSEAHLRPGISRLRVGGDFARI